MITAAVVITAAALVGLFAAGPARPRSAARTWRRRVHQLRRNPGRATTGDVEHILGSELPADVTAQVCRLAESREVPPDLLWTWADLHSPALLALALSAGFSRRDLALTKPADSALDRESLEMLAELNGAVVGSMVVRAVHPTALNDRHEVRFGHGPTGWAA